MAADVYYLLLQQQYTELIHVAIIKTMFIVL